MRYLGYDFGTTNTLVSQYSPSETHLCTKILDERSSAIPEGDRFIRSPKRLMSGTSFDLIKAGTYLQRKTNEVFAKVFPGALRTSPFKLTVTVPNAFKDHQCQLMLDTVRNVCQSFSESALCTDAISIIPEPIAAALYYVYSYALTRPSPGLLVVCDVGGGTTDLAIVKYTVEGNDDKKVSFRVLCTEGDPLLGGDDIDDLIIEDIVNRFLLDRTTETEKPILSAARALKRQLSYQDIAEVVLTSPDGHTPASYTEGEYIQLQMSRKRLERKMMLSSSAHPSFYGRFIKLAEALKKSFKIIVQQSAGEDDNVEEIVHQCLKGSCILPVGGTSQIPGLRALMKECFLGEIFVLPGEMGDENGYAPYDSVVRGAAIYSACRDHALDGVSDIVIEGRTLHRIALLVNERELETIVEKNMPSDTYTPKRDLFPLKYHKNGITFNISQIHLYEGEGATVDDDSSGTLPVRLQSYSNQLENLSDPLYIHGRELQKIPINVLLKIDNGRLAALSIHIPEGNEDRSDYQNTITFIQQ